MSIDNILEYEGIVYLIINKYTNYFDKDDLYQVGMIGLINACKNYKTDQNTKFSSYAYFYVLGEVNKYIRESTTFKVSKELIKLNSSIQKARNILQQKLLREPTKLELSLYLEIEEDKIVAAEEANSFVSSLDELNDEEQDLYNQVYCLENGYNEDILDLKTELNNLDNFSKKLIEERYFNEKSQSETSSVLGINQVAVSRQEKEILTRLRTRLK